MKLKELYLRNDITFENVECANIDRHTILLKDGDVSTLVFKHAVNGCEGITTKQLEAIGDVKYAQNSHLAKWQKDKAPLEICIDGKIINSVIDSSTDFFIFLSQDRFINKSRVIYIKGPSI